MSDDFQKTPGISLADMLGRSPFNDDEIGILRRRAWAEQGILIIQLSDHRLTIPEALYLREIAERIYGGLSS